MGSEKKNIRILFLTEKEIIPSMGGTERITQTLSVKFMAKGIPCYSAYLDSAPIDMPLAEFTASRRITIDSSLAEQITAILQDFRITDCIVNFVSQKSKVLVMPTLYKVSRPMGIKVYFCYHAMPGEDFYRVPSFSYSLYRLWHRYDIPQALKDILLTLTPKCLWRHRVQQKYRLAYDNSDATILLSNNFIPIYKQLAGIGSDDKFRVIASALSFNTFLPKEDIAKKSKEVLIISRMQERSKRLSLALKIWKQIEQYPELNDWTLTIIGGGPDLDYYHRMHKRLGLKRCSLMGRVLDIDPYYERAAIFMMTSAYEGFGLTLIEAQQNGVVPIVFNSYASLTDIVTHEQNGIIVPEGEVQTYVDQLRRLMLNTAWRQTIAAQALDDCKRFKVEKAIDLWMKILDTEEI